MQHTCIHNIIAYKYKYKSKSRWELLRCQQGGLGNGLKKLHGII